METIKNLSEIAPQDLSALERVIGAPLDPARHQAVVVRVLPVASSTSESHVAGTLPEWCNVLEGFSDEDFEEFDAILANRPKLSH
ncbi:MAG TPA: hypothetical protein VFI31_17475 [Pirellulales bacterium]|nr:hypothetical protein [Pirellulales bacterium]